MAYDRAQSIEILSRTPHVLTALLEGISDVWSMHNEGPETWSPYDVIGHLNHAERTNWVPRAEIMRSNAADKTFPPFDRFAQFEASKGKTLSQLLEEFHVLRNESLDYLRGLRLDADELAATAIHPSFGEVHLSELLSAWVVHDLTHLAQISRVMAKRYTEEVGPWSQFFTLLQPRGK